MVRRVIGLVILAAAVAMGSTPLYQSKFSKANTDWTALRGEATADAAVAHGGNASLRVEPSGQAQDAAVRLAPVSLTLWKTYELSGWIRTQNLEVKDAARTPIASGATTSTRDSRNQL